MHVRLVQYLPLFAANESLFQGTRREQSEDMLAARDATVCAGNSFFCCFFRLRIELILQSSG